MSKVKPKDIEVEITEEDYQEALAQGVEAEYALKPGKHKFRRGGFLERHPNFANEPKEIKIRASLWLDFEVVNFFKQRAGLNDGELLEGASALINEVLREFMEREKATTTKPEDLSVQLLDNDQFINEVAKRVQEKLKDSAA